LIIPMASTMDAAMDATKAQLVQLRSKLDDIPALQNLEDQTNVPKEYIAISGAFGLLLIVIFGFTASTICSLIGFLYPAIKSLHAIESTGGVTNNPDVTQWLIYWVIYSFFTIIEVFVDFLLYWIPHYHAFKLAFLLWAMLPQTRGAKFLYDSFLKDFLKSKESTIDAAMRDVRSSSSAIASPASEAMGENVKKDE